MSCLLAAEAEEVPESKLLSLFDAITNLYIFEIDY